jgi:NADPH:quinone reductase-like Zn-dependent oxidoreductase
VEKVCSRCRSCWAPDLSGVVEQTGQGVSYFAPGMTVFGVTNPRFTGAYAEYAAADAVTLAGKPAGLTHVEAASVPVVASTAWQMVHDHARIRPGQRVLVQGGAGNVGAYAVQLCRLAGAQVVATARRHQLDYARSLGASEAIEPGGAATAGYERDFDAVLDTIGGGVLQQSYGLLRQGGTLVSAAAEPD